MAYRDDIEALEGRERTLRAELRDVEAQLEAHASLGARAEALREELGRVEDALNARTATEERRLSDLATRLSLPVLHRVRIASPCRVRWEEMTGDDHVRLCRQCDKHVYDLSSLTRAQATKLLAKREGDMCVTYYRRADGTIMTSDCDARARRRKRGAGLALVAAAAVAAGAALGGDAPPTPPGVKPPPPCVLMAPEPIEPEAPAYDDSWTRVAGGLG